MTFADRYIAALNSSNLHDDEHHGATEALAAAALADLSGGSGSVFGSMLTRAKYADGVPRKTFESSTANLAPLLRAWKEVVYRKGRDRKWIKVVYEWDIHALEGICNKIALHSLAHWLGGECTACNGTKINAGRACAHCSETPGREPVQGGPLERIYIKDMISDLEGMYQSHAARAGAKMRRAA